MFVAQNHMQFAPDMLTQYLCASTANWASQHIHYRGAWRLRTWAWKKQMQGVQKVGAGLLINGPVYIDNRGQIEIGDHVELRSSWHRPISISVVDTQAHLQIEDGVFINWGVSIGVAREVIIGALTLIADDCIIYDTDWHSMDGLDRNITPAPTTIGRGVWLCARTVVLKGVTIGDNSVVAANSVVTSSIPSNVLAAGAPARVIRAIERKRYVGGV